MCVALPDCICKQGSRLRSPTPSPLMKIRFAWPLPIVARGESGRAGMPADQIRFAWPTPLWREGRVGGQRCPRTTYASLAALASTAPPVRGWAR